MVANSNSTTRSQRSCRLARPTLAPARVRPLQSVNLSPTTICRSPVQLLYHKLIEHINRVFSSVLQQGVSGGELTSRSTNALHAGYAQQQQQQQQHNSLMRPLCQHARARSQSMRRPRRRLSGGGGAKRHQVLCAKLTTSISHRLPLTPLAGGPSLPPTTLPVIY
jgi:hypothetical protein